MASKNWQEHKQVLAPLMAPQRSYQRRPPPFLRRKFQNVFARSRQMPADPARCIDDQALTRVRPYGKISFLVPGIIKAASSKPLPQNPRFGAAPDVCFPIGRYYLIEDPQMPRDLRA